MRAPLVSRTRAKRWLSLHTARHPKSPISRGISQMLQPITPLDDAFSTGSGGPYIETLLYNARYETLSASILATSPLYWRSFDPTISV
ncbi:hypothetical protein PV325_006373 [Microctonus aethiopoides]|nr:hypothetical protein PV325_006373 [Microctonus aethiopoides]